MNPKTLYALSKFYDYKVRQTMITINLTPRQLQILNSALSTYYSTRHQNNPIKTEVSELKHAMLEKTVKNNVTPTYAEYDQV